jgi:hypothetical protein
MPLASSEPPKTLGIGLRYGPDGVLQGRGPVSEDPHGLEKSRLEFRWIAVYKSFLAALYYRS